MFSVCTVLVIWVVLLPLQKNILRLGIILAVECVRLLIWKLLVQLLA